MFCGNCGTQNADGAVFCAGCGAPLNQAQQPSYPQQPQYAPPSYPQQPAVQEYYPPQPAYPQQPVSMPHQKAPADSKKKMWMTILIASVSVAVIAIVLLFVLGGGSGFSNPEDAALSFVEGSLTGDWDMCEAAIYPDMIDEDLKSEFERDVMQELGSLGIEADNIAIKSSEDVDSYELEYLDQWMREDYGVSVTDARYVRVSYEYSVWGMTASDSYSVTVVEIDGSWYVIPD
ncbi:MAG: zinc ribbon domain-containing protein [Ruminococcaceae bacterium]|nr:zinc ribbon domain-containing protein [Oscillospiraceae bacterium]